MDELDHVGMRVRNFKVKNMKYRDTVNTDNGNTRMTEIEVGYLSKKSEGIINMGAKWATKFPAVKHNHILW